MAKRILRKPEIAQRGGVSVRMLERFWAEGRGPRKLKLGRRLVGSEESDVDEWVEELRKQHAVIRRRTAAPKTTETEETGGAVTL
jgi:predicted DNA-binding transcriptional regulator AlpA